MQKLCIVMVLCGVVSVGFASSVQAQECAVFFEHARYEGAEVPVYAGDDVPWIGDEWNDIISSFKVRRGCTLTVYEHARYEGASQTYTSDTSYVGDGWNDQISGFTCQCAVDNKCATVYEHANYEGAKQKIKDGDSVSWVGDKWNDMISSVKVHSGCSLTLYEHANYEGASQSYGRDVGYVGDGWNDKASAYTCVCGGR